MANKNFFLGLGIGIIFSSIVFYISFIVINNASIKATNVVEMTDEQIISKAKELGMRLFSELPATKATNLSDDAIILKAGELGMLFESQRNTEKDLSKTDPIDSNKTTELIEFNIPPGSSSERVAKILYELKLIEDTESFSKYTKDNNKSTRIRAGNFKINKGSTYGKILEVLTTQPN